MSSGKKRLRARKCCRKPGEHHVPVYQPCLSGPSRSNPREAGRGLSSPADAAQEHGVQEADPSRSQHGGARWHGMPRCSHLAQYTPISRGLKRPGQMALCPGGSHVGNQGRCMSSRRRVQCAGRLGLPRGGQRCPARPPGNGIPARTLMGTSGCSSLLLAKRQHGHGTPCMIQPCTWLPRHLKICPPPHLRFQRQAPDCRGCLGWLEHLPGLLQKHSC